MNKNLVAIAIAGTIGFGVAHAQTNEPNKVNFSLSPPAKSFCLDINSRPELKSYLRMQECLKKIGENYTLTLVIVDNKPAFLPDITQYPESIAKPEQDNKFLIKDWNWPREFKLKNDYGKKSQGIMIFEYNHK